MSNYKRMNTNTLQLGQDQGTCSIIPQTSNRIKCQMDLVKSTGANLIDYNESTNTIDFNNATIANFTGGGGGGGGDAFLANTQTFTGVNTFSANTVLSTVDTGNVSTTGSVTASGNVTGGTLITTGTVECNKVESVGNVEIATGNLVVTTGAGTIGGALTTNGLGNTGDITNTGDLSTATQTTTGNHVIGGDCVVTGQIRGNGGLNIASGTSTVGAISTNNISTTGTISCNSNIQGASLSAAAGDITCTAGNINGLSLQSNGGQVLLKTGNARIEADTNDDTRIQANGNVNTIVCRLGATGNDNLQLSYDSVANKSVLKLYDFGDNQYYNVGGSPDDLAGLIASIENTSLTFNGSTTGTFQGSLVSTGTSTLSGTVVNLGTGTNTAIITCMNDTADRMNVNAGKIQLDTTATLAKTGSVSGATDIFTSVDTVLNRSATSWVPTLYNIVASGTGSGTDIELIAGTNTITVSVASSIIFTQFGTSGGTPIYRVTGRGRLRFTTVTTSANINLFTLPAGLRPTVEQNFISQGHSGISQARIDISTAGLVTLIGSATTTGSQFVNLGSIDLWSGI